jgi:hypothetical protein
LDKEAQKPVGKAEAEDEEVALHQCFRELWELAEFLIEVQEHVVIPDDKVAIGLGPTEALINKAKRTSTGFVVRAKAKAAVGTFSYRVVAKRKDIAAPRFEKVTLPPESLHTSASH